MKIYRVTIYAEDDAPNRGEHVGYQYFASKQRARIEQNAINRGCRKWVGSHELDEIEIAAKPTRRLIIQLLNEYGGHPNNG